MQTIDRLGSVYEVRDKDSHEIKYWRIQYYENGKQKQTSRQTKKEAETLLYSMPRNIVCLERLITHCKPFENKSTIYVYGDYSYDDLNYEIRTKRYRVHYHAIHENGETVVSEIKAFGPKGNQVFYYLYHGSPAELVPPRKFQLLCNDLKEAVKCSS